MGEEFNIDTLKEGLLKVIEIVNNSKTTDETVLMAMEFIQDTIIDPKEIDMTEEDLQEVKNMVIDEIQEEKDLLSSGMSMFYSIQIVDHFESKLMMIDGDKPEFLVDEIVSQNELPRKLCEIADELNPLTSPVVAMFITPRGIENDDSDEDKRKDLINNDNDIIEGQTTIDEFIE